MAEAINTSPVPMPTRLVRPQRCENCKFVSPSSDNGPPECHFGPPGVNTIVAGHGKDPRTGAMQPITFTVSAFPRVEPTDWCAQWAARVIGAAPSSAA